MTTIHARGELNIHRFLLSKDFCFNKTHSVVVNPQKTVTCQEFLRGNQFIVFVIDGQHLNEDIKIVFKPLWVQLIFYAPTFEVAHHMPLKHDIAG